MRLRWIALFIILTLVSIMFWNIFQAKNSPEEIIATLTEVLSKSGFTNSKIDNISQYEKHILIEDISLDKHGFSNIGFLQISRDNSNITIKNATLTGEYNDGVITISGLEQSSKSALSKIVKTLQADHIKIQNFSLDLSTKIGIIRLELNADIKRKSDHHEIQALLWAKQKQFTIESHWSGNFQDFDNLDLTGDIQRAKFDFANIQASRASGKTTFKLNRGIPSIDGQLISGAFRILGIPFNNGKLSLFDEDKKIKYTVSGHNYTKQRTPDNRTDLKISGQISPLTYSIEVKTPQSQNIAYIISDNLIANENSEEIEKLIETWKLAKTAATINLEDDDKSTKIKATFNSEDIKIEGTITNKDNGLHILNLTSKDLPAHKINTLLPLNEKTFSLSDGNISVASNIALRRLQTENPKNHAYDYKANAAILLKQVSGQAKNQLSFTDLNGRIDIADLSTLAPEETSNLETKTVQFGPFKADNVDIQLNNRFSINAIKTQHWEISNIQLEQNEATLTLTESNPTDISEHFDLNGKLSGKLDIKWERQDQPTIYSVKGKITSDGPGTITLSKSLAHGPSHQQNEQSQKRQAAIMAMTDFEYSDLEFSINRTPHKKTIAHVKAMGKNIKSFGNRAIDINMDINELADDYLHLLFTPNKLGSQYEATNE